MLRVSAAFLSASAQASVIVQQKQTYAKFPTIPKVGQPHRRDRREAGQWFWEKKEEKKCGETTWPGTHQSVNSGSRFHPQEVIKAFRWSTGDLEPFLRHEGHGDQLSFGGGGPAGGGRVRLARPRSLTSLHVSPSGQSRQYEVNVNPF